MNIQQLRYFIEIANTSNLSSAARNLFVTQPTLSLALKKMENELGTPLFTHINQPYQLTESGQHLYKKGQLIVEDFDELIGEIHDIAQGNQKKEKIILGITTLFAVQFMKEISSFLSTHPHVDLIIQQDGSPYLQKKLEAKELDMGLISFPNLHTETIVMEALDTSTKGYHVYVVLPEDNPLTQYEELTVEQLKDQRFSSLTTKFMIGRLLVNQSRSLGFEPNIVLHNDDLQVLLHSLKKNDSIALLPIEYREVGMSKGLKWIPLKDKHSYFPIGIALRKDYEPSQDVQDFIKIIKNN